MKKKPQKTKKTIKVSNEELARMIAEGFASTATREDIMLLNKRIDATKAFLETTIPVLLVQILFVQPGIPHRFDCLKSALW